jgi:hypothetical protein
MDPNIFYLKKTKNLLIHENESYELLLSYKISEISTLLSCESEEELDIKLFKDEIEDVKNNNLLSEMIQFELEKNKKLIKQINFLLKKNCKHDYEYDYIESSVEGTLHKIHYCRYCELNKYEILNG